MNPALRMILARQRAAEIREMAERGRPRAGGRKGRPDGPAPFRRLPDGSWIYRRRDSS
jgi:hypothetical protein